MTFAIFFVLILALFIAVLNVLPVASALPLAFSSALVSIIGFMKAWNFFFPITEIFICVGIVLTFDLIVWGFHWVWKVMKFLRGHSDGS